MARITQIKAVDDRSNCGAARLVASIGVSDQGRITAAVIVFVDPQTPNAPTMARSAAVGAFIRRGFIRIIRAIRGQKPALAALEQHDRQNTGSGT